MTRMKTSHWAILSCSFFLLGLAACHSNSGPQTVPLIGAGSTFVYPAMSRWTADFQQLHPNAHINYQSIGSGGGIQQVKAGTVDFGATDLALTDAQLKNYPPVLQIPESAGPVCITYNLQGIQQPVKLTAAALAGIYLGNVKKWNDKEITESNPGVQLPNLPIVVVHRSEGSGTTGIFTTYLSAVSPEWKSRVGAGTSVAWPLGLGGKGNEGVTGQVHDTPGAIGYVELAYATENKLPLSPVQNLSGNFVTPSEASTTAAINAFTGQLKADPRSPIVNPPAAVSDAYPIAGLTFLLIPKDGTDKAKRTMLKQFVQYVVSAGQTTAETLNYSPLPSAVQDYDQQTLGQMTANGQPIQ